MHRCTMAGGRAELQREATRHQYQHGADKRTQRHARYVAIRTLRLSDTLTNERHVTGFWCGCFYFRLARQPFPTNSIARAWLQRVHLWKFVQGSHEFNWDPAKVRSSIRWQGSNTIWSFRSVAAVLDLSSSQRSRCGGPISLRDGEYETEAGVYLATETSQDHEFLEFAVRASSLRFLGVHHVQDCLVRFKRPCPRGCGEVVMVMGPRLRCCLT